MFGSRRVRPRRRLELGTGTGGRTLEPRLLAAADVLTYHNDNARTGQNLQETTLAPGNVNAATFGKVAQIAVDGSVFAQPLYRSGVTLPDGTTHNLLLIATEHDSVYAFDAQTLAPIWHDSFINPAAGITTVPAADTGAFDVSPEIGITSTPVIDPATNRMFVVSRTKQVVGSKANYAYQLHALDVATGQEELGGPVTIQASSPGRGDGSKRGRIAFNPLRELQRTALLLSNGVVYFAFASQGDIDPYHGWIMGYSAQTLRQVSVFNPTPGGGRGGIWMSGSGGAADSAGNIYFAVGNGTFDAGSRRPRNVGDSAIKLRPNARGQLMLADSFTPFNQAHLAKQDLDFGSAGVVLLPDQAGPHPHLLVTSGKEGKVYVIDRDDMGGYSKNRDKVVQTIPNAFGPLFATPAYFNGTIYAAGVGGRTNGKRAPLGAFTISNGLFSQTGTGPSGYGYPGSTPSVSASGANNGIVWSLDNAGHDGKGPAILHANLASNISVELYSSTQAGARDTAGGAVKFTVPTIADGRVYVGGDKAVTVYGLLGP